MQHRSRTVRRRVALAALALTAAPLAPAEPASEALAPVLFEGLVTDARFGCHRPYRGPASVGLTVGHGGGLFATPSTDDFYDLDGARFDRTSFRRLDAYISLWEALGSDSPNHAWYTPDPGTVEGWREFHSGTAADRRSGFSYLNITGTGGIVHVNAAGDEVTSCEVVWRFVGIQRGAPSRPPKAGKWQPAGKTVGVKAELAGARKGRAGVEVRETVAVVPCAPATACFAYTAKAAPELLVRSRTVDGRDVVLYLPLGPRAAEVWSLGPGEGEAQARPWLVPPAPATGVARAGFVDLVGYPTAEAGELVGTLGAGEDAPLEPGGIRSLAAELATRGNAPPPGGPWLTTPALPGFRFKGRLGSAALVVAKACPRGTLCLGPTAAAQAEVFARVTARQANGKRWVLAGKFTDAGVSLWVQQGTSGPIRQYSLAPRDPESGWLPALVDRAAFNG